MTAKEMFEELGYTLVKETKAVIEYKKKIFSFGAAYDRVSFSLTSQSYNTTGKTGQGNPSYGSVYLPLAKAIIQKMKELGWIE